MIQANELRIGNYFRGIGGIQTVLSLEENTDRGKCTYSSEEHRLMYSHLILCHQNGNQYKPFEVEPIPITEEILLKCGAKKGGSTFWLSEDLVIGIDLEFVGIYTDRNEDDIELDCPKYLHQLQNLYFALTGKELNINIT